MALTQQQEEYLQETLTRGQFFEQMVNIEGWAYVKSYYEARLQTYANNLLMSEDKKIEEFENERQRLIGIKQLFGQVNSDIKTLKDERNKTTTTTKK